MRILFGYETKYEMTSFGEVKKKIYGFFCICNKGDF